jgi:hypothetical protein
MDNVDFNWLEIGMYYHWMRSYVICKLGYKLLDVGHSLLLYLEIWIPNNLTVW